MRIEEEDDKTHAVPLVDKYHDEVLSDDDIDSTLESSATPERNARAQHRTSRLCACQRLTRTYIAISAAAAVAFLLILTSGGYWAYKNGLIDGQSPPWYPTPLGGTVSTWAKSYEKAQILVEKMSLVEKVNITTGTGWAMDLCVGVTGAAASAGFPALCLQDGPLGIRFADHADSFPAGITVGSTWSRELMRKRGEEHAREAKLKGSTLR